MENETTNRFDRKMPARDLSEKPNNRRLLQGVFPATSTSIELLSPSSHSTSSTSHTLHPSHSSGDETDDDDFYSDDEYVYEDGSDDDNPDDGTEDMFKSSVPIATMMKKDPPAPTPPRLHCSHTPAGLAMCADCQLESHQPVRDCRIPPHWIQIRRRLPTFPGEATVQWVMDSIVSQVGQQNGGDVDDPMALCEANGWNIAAAIDAATQDPDTAPVDLTPAPGFIPQLRRMYAMFQQIMSGTTTCAICMEDGVPSDQMKAATCGHRFCQDCWHGYLTAALHTTAPAALISCPEAQCNETMHEPMVESIDAELVPLYRSMRRNIFVALQRDIRWCPGVECDAVALRPTRMFEDVGNNSIFHCATCRTSFCFDCGNDPHEGACVFPGALVEAAAAALTEEELGVVGTAMAEAQREPVVAMADDLLYTSRDNHKRKQCPKCKVVIEKNGGCNRMTCKCRHAFCWLCLGDYADYNSHKCSRNGTAPPVLNITVDLEYVRNLLLQQNPNPAPPEELLDAKIKIEELSRFAYHFNRFFVHHQGQQFAEDQCGCLEARTNVYTDINDLKASTECDFFRLANETLVMSRRLLKFAYCATYYSQRTNVEDTENAHLGFLCLDRLERFTEELSELSENALTRLDRMRVLQLIEAVKQTMGAVKDFEQYETMHRT